jgi:hypothetical protein
VPVFTPSLDLFTELRAFRKAVLGAPSSPPTSPPCWSRPRRRGDADDTDAEYEPFKRVPIDRGMMTTLPPGMKMSSSTAKQPATTYEMFQEKCLGEACRPLSYPLNLALGTSQKFNFSRRSSTTSTTARGSGRAGRLRAGRAQPAVPPWYTEAVLAGAVPAYDGRHPAAARVALAGVRAARPVVDAQADHERLAERDAHLPRVLGEKDAAGTTGGT